MADLMVELDISGFEEILRREPLRVEAWLAGFSEDMVTNIKESFGTSPPGKVYSRGSGRTHVASLPGFPPNVDYALLINSIYQERTGYLEHTVYVGAEYAADLEDGTEKIAARPFMRPEFDSARRRIEPDAARNLKLE